MGYYTRNRNVKLARPAGCNIILEFEREKNY